MESEHQLAFKEDIWKPQGNKYTVFMWFNGVLHQIINNSTTGRIKVNSLGATISLYLITEMERHKAACYYRISKQLFQ